MWQLATSLLLAATLGLGCSRKAAEPGRDASPPASPPVAEDDAHNHDGSHPEAAVDCGGDYMLPGAVARLGSHSFMILGPDGEQHVIAEHRSGTPPHNYQILLRLRLDEGELAAYQRIARTSRTLPAFTTITFDASGTQVDRTFFCLADLTKVPFPIRASWQQDADHEGSFDIKGSISRGDHLTLERDEVEVLVARYLPAYLPQEALRAAIATQPDAVVPRLRHAPIRADESVATAARRVSYMAGDGSIAAAGRSCPRNTYLRDQPVPETIHTFVLVAEAGEHAVIATHYYDHAPQNFQTVLRLALDDEELARYRRAAASSTGPLLFQTSSTFCMQDLRKLLKSGKLAIEGTLYAGATLDAYQRGTPVGVVKLAAAEVEVLVNRRLESLMDPVAVAQDVLGDTKWSAGR